MRMVSRRAMLSGTGALALLPAIGWSQDQTLKIVYPFPAGNAADAIARLIADRLHRRPSTRDAAWSQEASLRLS